MIGRLITLEELMKRFAVERLLDFADEAGGVGAIYESLKFLKVGNLENALGHLNDTEQGTTLTHTAQMREFLEQSSLPVTALSVGAVYNILANPNTTVSQLASAATEVRNTLRREVSISAYFSVTPAEAMYYANPWKGWEAIVGRFKGTTDDIEEMSKCFALARYPACVFHSLQVAEVGVVELGNYIGVKDPRPGWDATRNELKRILAKKYPDRTAFEQANSSFVEQMNATVEALQTAWRNKSTHVDGRLVLVGQGFSGDVAEDIMYATRAFMRRIALDMPMPTSGTI